MIDEKIQQAVEILKEKQIDMWLTFVRETGVMADPVIDYIAGAGVTWQSAFIITAKGDTLAIVGNLDEAAMKSRGNYKEVVSYVQSIREIFLNTLKRFDPKKIAINYSLGVPIADGLSTGMYLQLLEYLQDTPYKDRLVSSEGIIGALRGRKTPEEIKRMKEAILITLEIFRMVGDFINVGRTEAEIAAFVLAEVEKRGLEKRGQVTFFRWLAIQRRIGGAKKVTSPRFSVPVFPAGPWWVWSVGRLRHQEDLRSSTTTISGGQSRRRGTERVPMPLVV